MWLQAHVTVDKPRTALVALLFENHGAASVTLTDAADEPMFEPAPGETPLWQSTRVTGLFASDTDTDRLRTAVSRVLAAPPACRFALEPLQERDWERAWLDRFGPMRFGSRLWVRPTGGHVAQRDAVIVDLDPGLAFGTGTHPTTALCLSWLDRHPPAGIDVVDLGCGSGILGIAALKLGARSVVAIDHDPQALLATRRNADRNEVLGRIRIGHEGEVEVVPAGLLLANILANVLVDLSTHIAGSVAPGGHLVMSGILDEQLDAVSAAFAGHFHFVETGADGDWTLLHGVRLR
jgi:ribosomal protein L11 methyltransferase